MPRMTELLPRTKLFIQVDEGVMNRTIPEVWSFNSVNKLRNWVFTGDTIS